MGVPYVTSHNKVNPLFERSFDSETGTHECEVRIQLRVEVRGRPGSVPRGARTGSGVWTWKGATSGLRNR